MRFVRSQRILSLRRRSFGIPCALLIRLCNGTIRTLLIREYDSNNRNIFTRHTDPCSSSKCGERSRSLILSRCVTVIHRRETAIVRSGDDDGGGVGGGGGNRVAKSSRACNNYKFNRARPPRARRRRNVSHDRYDLIARTIHPRSAG